MIYMLARARWRDDNGDGVKQQKETNEDAA